MFSVIGLMAMQTTPAYAASQITFNATDTQAAPTDETTKIITTNIPTSPTKPLASDSPAATNTTTVDPTSTPPTDPTSTPPTDPTPTDTPAPTPTNTPVPTPTNTPTPKPTKTATPWPTATATHAATATPTAGSTPSATATAQATSTASAGLLPTTPAQGVPPAINTTPTQVTTPAASNTPTTSNTPTDTSTDTSTPTTNQTTPASQPNKGSLASTLLPVGGLSVMVLAAAGVLTGLEVRRRQNAKRSGLSSPGFMQQDAQNLWMNSGNAEMLYNQQAAQPPMSNMPAPSMEELMQQPLGAFLGANMLTPDGMSPPAPSNTGSMQRLEPQPFSYTTGSIQTVASQEPFPYETTPMQTSQQPFYSTDPMQMSPADSPMQASAPMQAFHPIQMSPTGPLQHSAPMPTFSPIQMSPIVSSASLPAIPTPETTQYAPHGDMMPLDMDFPEPVAASLERETPHPKKVPSMQGVQDDPVFESIMRQAQMGIFVLLDQEPSKKMPEEESPKS